MKTVTYDDAAWKLVPLEPTVQMINDGQCGCMDNDVTVSIYEAMLATAPTPPVVNQQLTIGVDQSFVNLTPETAAYTTAQPSAQGETVYRSADILKAFNNGFDLGLRQRTSQDRKNDETLADTQRRIIEAAEQRGYARAKSECGQDAERYRWATALDDNSETLHSIVLSFGGDQAKIDERVDVYRDCAARAAKRADHG